MRKTVHFDYETRSPLDIKVGVHRQVEHPDTEPLCLAFHLSDDPFYDIWIPRGHEFGPDSPVLRPDTYGVGVRVHTYSNIPAPLLAAVNDPDYTFTSHNIEFELAFWNQICAKRYGWPKLKFNRVDCTMARCGAVSLPLGLDAAVAALNLGIKKDSAGQLIMRRMCAPKKLASGLVWIWNPSDLATLARYCLQDIRVEETLSETIPHLTAEQKEILATHLKVNFRGFFTDIDLIECGIAFADKVVEDLGSLATAKLGGAFTADTIRSPSAFIRAFEEEFHVSLPDASADTVRSLISGIGLKLTPQEQFIEASKGIFAVRGEPIKVPERAKIALACREQIAKASVAKYRAFREMRSPEDGRVRGCYCLYAAGTGRFGGRGPQPQNLPKPVKWKRPDGSKKTMWPLFVEQIKGTRFKEFWETLGSVPGDIVPKGMTALADCIRPIIRAHPDKILVSADWSAVEARGVQWLAGDKAGLDAFSRYDAEDRWEDDPYVQMAAYIYRKDASEISESERALGKAVILGCGYGMGANKFFITCDSWGIPVTLELATRAVNAYRELHLPVKKLWRNTESAAMKAVERKGSVQRVEGCPIMYKYDGPALKCRLPSGRLLWYWHPTIREEMTPFGKLMPKLYHFGSDSMTRKWAEFPIHGGVLVENNTQALCADLLMDALFRLKRTKFDVVHHAHDEIVAEIPANDATEVDLFQFEDIMQVVPAWARGFPLRAKGWMGDHYRK